MTSKEFVVWMQGFVEACNEYSPTPKQWDTLKDKLGEVKDERTTLTVSSGSSGTITYNPSTTTLWNPSGSAWSYTSTSTAYGYPSGSAWNYTSTLPQQPTTGSNQLELDFEKK
jgi:hypothetical protein